MAASLANAMGEGGVLWFAGKHDAVTGASTVMLARCGVCSTTGKCLQICVIMFSCVKLLCRSTNLCKICAKSVQICAKGPTFHTYTSYVCKVSRKTFNVILKKASLVMQVSGRPPLCTAEWNRQHRVHPNGTIRLAAARCTRPRRWSRCNRCRRVC